MVRGQWKKCQQKQIEAKKMRKEMVLIVVLVPVIESIKRKKMTWRWSSSENDSKAMLIQ